MFSAWSVLKAVAFQVVLGFDLQIFHTNDMHSRFGEINRSTGPCHRIDDWTCYGGFARVAQFVRNSRKNNSLFLNAGDTFQGTPLFVSFGHEIVQPMVDLLGIDTMSLGNHEFDRGPKVLKEYLSQVHTPVVTCNVDGSMDPDFVGAKLKDYTVFSFNAVNVGVVGYLTPETKELASTGNVNISDEIACIRKHAQSLKSSGVQIVIAVGHSGWRKDLEIAEKVDEVDLVIGGHTDTFLYTGTPPDIEEPEGLYPTIVTQESGKRVPAVQAYGYTKYVGVLNLRFDDETFRLTEAFGNPVLMTSNIWQDKKILELLDNFEHRVSIIYKTVVGTTKVDLNGSCRKSECNLGNFAADSYTEFVETHSNLKNDDYLTIGLLNGGAIRSSLLLSGLENGSILLEDLVTVLPFSDHLQHIRVDGAQLMDVLTHSYNCIGKGCFLQVSSSFKVAYPQGGKRITAVVERRDNKLEEVHLDKMYDLVITDYMLKGGDGFNFSRAEIIQSYPVEVLEILKESVSRKSPLDIKETGRIVLFVTDAASSAVSTSLSLLCCFMSFVSALRLH